MTKEGRARQRDVLGALVGRGRAARLHCDDHALAGERLHCVDAGGDCGARGGTASPRRARMLTLVSAILLAALVRPGWAAETLTLDAVADTYADASAPSTPFGSNSRLLVDGSPARVMYLRFVVSDTVGQAVTAARLRLQVSSGTGDSAGRIRRLADDVWDESTLTWNSRPPADGPVLYTLGPVPSGGIAEFVLDGAVAGDGTYSFTIDGTSGDGLAYYSSTSRGGLRPALILTLEPRGTAVTILRPAEGDTLLAGNPIVFEGSATAETGEDLSDAIAWTSSVDGPLGVGAELAVGDLTAGPHLLTAEVTDAGGTIATHSVSIAVTESAAMLAFPAIADTYVDSQIPRTTFGAAALLKADASPTRQAFLRFEIRGTGGAPVHGAHLRLTVGSASTDESPSGGRIHAISNHAWTEAGTSWTNRPAVDGVALVGQGEAAANTVLDFDVTNAVTGDGTYDFALVTTSSDGVAYRSRESTIGAPELLVRLVPGDRDQPPSVTIDTPPDGITVGEGTTLTFFGGALDPEDGDLSTSLRGTSSLDGLLGSGEMVDAVLSLGAHTITATATDAALGMGSARVRVTVSRFAAMEGPSFGSSVQTNENRATGEKPESKLWYHDGRWWGTLFNPAAGAHRIHRLDLATQTWIDDGATVDPRPQSRQDTLSVGNQLYMVSRFAGTPRQNRLMRYSYTASGHYEIDPGFPVNIAGAGTETLTIARDSTGTLWIAYVGGRQVRVSHTLGSDTVWSTPFTVPVPEGTTVGHDDIAAVTALPGAIGVFWNSHVYDRYYLAIHTDGLPADDPAAWRQESVYHGRNGADDHLNVKVAADGRLFAAVKTDLSGPTSTLIGLLVRSPDGVWAPLSQVMPLSNNATRPICMLDEDRRLVHVFYSLDGQAIHYKSSPMDAIAFPPGNGVPFIRSAGSGGINNPTSTKQSVGLASGLVVLASSPVKNRYWYNVFPPEF